MGNYIKSAKLFKELSKKVTYSFFSKIMDVLNIPCMHSLRIQFQMHADTQTE